MIQKKERKGRHRTKEGGVIGVKQYSDAYVKQKERGSERSELGPTNQGLRDKISIYVDGLNVDRSPDQRDVLESDGDVALQANNKGYFGTQIGNTAKKAGRYTTS